MSTRREQEKRDNYRASDGRNALLRCGRNREFVLEVVEVAAWGFTLISDDPLPVKEDTLYKLRTSAGWSEVKLVHQQEQDGKHRYGMSREADLPDPRDDEHVLATGSGRLKHKLPKERIANVGYFVVLGFALAVYLYYTYN